ncbi:hypothetical protein VE03_06127 [Pseudogymnoascus sp. 23342-1-I1]|nr:hypothetical protein VE03_06127 [Pseudogymnoascus sp. 23342-1-I1]
MDVITWRGRIDSRSSPSEHFDSETGASTIEFYNDSKDRYRTAPFGRIPLPWPFNHGMASEKGKEMGDIFHPTVNEILEKYNIVPSSISVTKMWKRGIMNTAKDTAVVSTEDKDTAMWLSAADDIHHAVLPWATEASLQFRVEICNEDLMYKDISTALLCGEDIRNVFTEIEPLVLARVKHLIPGIWRSVTFHGRQSCGLPHRDPISNKPTVMVLVSIGARSLWDFVENEIRRVIEDVVPPNMDVSLEILPSNFVI